VNLRGAPELLRTPIAQRKQCVPHINTINVINIIDLLPVYQWASALYLIVSINSINFKIIINSTPPLTSRLQATFRDDFACCETKLYK